MKLVFADEAWEDYLYWQKQDRKMVERINRGHQSLRSRSCSAWGPDRLVFSNP
ncbi:type II toxin-antitoxin system YoeB family toxin [Acidithiobacillus sp.]|uniref:type II toxin-antitoxin system YoeB family toxin n=1 Tax=Acidithiobacillus sp. TaxID=1872118 RepID=UPI0025870D2E|nr:type II toxin-antitoxin system YoeB family toxin [Acidithiobacillus sp.]MDD5375457.1 type II toxin-antitoxin system YoeB family toxin [Acidithiobacillus sp.]